MIGDPRGCCAVKWAKSQTCGSSGKKVLLIFLAEYGGAPDDECENRGFGLSMASDQHIERIMRLRLPST